MTLLGQVEAEQPREVLWRRRRLECREVCCTGGDLGRREGNWRATGSDGRMVYAEALGVGVQRAQWAGPQAEV